MDSSGFPAGLEKDLDSFDAKTRAAAVEAFAKRAESGDLACKPETDDHNMHCHTFFSYNGYGFSPSRIACWARKEGLFAAGLVDFDVLDGVDEFLAATARLDVRSVCGMETRAFIEEFSSRVINSPGEPGIAYHMGVGFSSSQVPSAQKAFLESLRKGASDRTRGIVERVNPFLSPVELDFEKDVLPLTPSGNATERHVCAAYAAKADSHFNGDMDSLVKFWSEKLGLSTEAAIKNLEDAVLLQGSIRGKTMKSGGPGYVKAEPKSFPPLRAMNAFILACGAIPCVAWLNGESAGEAALDELLDLHEACGAAMMNIIPDRNWNFSDAELRRKRVAELDRIIATCVKRNMPIIVGTEMNAAGLKLVDTFSADALKPHVQLFVDGAALSFAHSLLAPHGMGLLSDWSKDHFGADKAKRNKFFSEFGRKARPSSAIRLARLFVSKAEPAKLMQEL
jgi:hypothetical protein